jgi:hypothetical protein
MEYSGFTILCERLALLSAMPFHTSSLVVMYASPIITAPPLRREPALARSPMRCHEQSNSTAAQYS